MIEFSNQHLTIVGVLLFVFSLLGVLSAIQAILTTRTSQGAIAWAMTLLTWPVVAVPAYWILGRNRFHGYVDARRDQSDSTFEKIRGLRGRMDPHAVDLGNEYGEARVIEKLARLRFSRNNHTTLLVNGEQTFAAIFAAIEQAKEYILVEFFIINDDQLGRQLQTALIDKAARRRGCLLAVR